MKAASERYDVASSKCARHERSRVADDGRGRKSRYLGERNPNRVLDLLGQSAKS
jgi:hypothetical protein